MTGQDIKRIFDSKKTYRGFLSNTRANDLFRESLVLSIESIYNGLQNQADYDSLLKPLKVNQVFDINNNAINCTPLDIVNITHPSDFSLTTGMPHNMKVGDSFTIVNVAGFATSINAVQVVTVVTSSTVIEFAATYTAGSYTAGTGQITTTSLAGVSKMAADYNHLLAVKTKYIRKVDATVTSISNSNPITITVSKRNNIKTGELLSISGVLVNTNANGDRYVKKITPTKFELYYDQDLTNSVSGNGIALGNAALNRVFYKYAVPMFSMNKVSEYEVASIAKPMFERGNNQLLFYPTNYTCSQITLDYISTDLIYIDVADADIDLLDSYSEDFIYAIINRAVQLFADRFSDTGLQQNALLEQQQSKT